MNSMSSRRVAWRKNKRNKYFLFGGESDQIDDHCIVCFDGDDFILCDRMGCPNPYHPSCVKRDEALFQANEKLYYCGEDKISDLPNSLLYHILSFIPIKDAATTSILSKRWTPLWLSQLVLNFDDEPFLDSYTFCNFVYSFIIKRDITLPIHSFNLKCCNYYYHNMDIYNFVYFAVQRGVENLNIETNILFFNRITLPSFVLYSKILSVLKLKWITLKNVPYVDLPSLKVLHLEHVTFTYYEYILKLLHGCPILEDLGATDLQVELPYSERPILKSLSNLVIANICNFHIEFDWLHNVECLHATVLMEKFPYALDRIAIFHNLTHMELIINTQYFLEMWKWKCLIKFLEYCPKLQSLIIDEDFTNNKLCDEDWEEPQIIPKCISSHLRTCTLRNYKGINCELHFAKYILKNSSVLSTMTIHRFVDTNDRLEMLMELSLCSKSSATCKLLII